MNSDLFYTFLIQAESTTFHLKVLEHSAVGTGKQLSVLENESDES